mmetsp:Transcript_9219/g.16609  ORF Transcript_9219/g.16609 Transcript_9219/m.16609 type:complete len:324 (+) Transcript_9219:67-1038(+)
MSDCTTRTVSQYPDGRYSEEDHARGLAAFVQQLLEKLKLLDEKHSEALVKLKNKSRPSKSQRAARAAEATECEVQQVVSSRNAETTRSNVQPAASSPAPTFGSEEGFHLVEATVMSQLLMPTCLPEEESACNAGPSDPTDEFADCVGSSQEEAEESESVLPDLLSNQELVKECLDICAQFDSLEGEGQVTPGGAPSLQDEMDSAPSHPTSESQQTITHASQLPAAYPSEMVASSKAPPFPTYTAVANPLHAGPVFIKWVASTGKRWHTEGCPYILDSTGAHVVGVKEKNLTKEQFYCPVAPFKGFQPCRCVLHAIGAPLRSCD